MGGAIRSSPLRRRDADDLERRRNARQPHAEISRLQQFDRVDAARVIRRLPSVPSEAAIGGLRDCYASLTPREREVMRLVVSGLLNKQVARELGISEITVRAHRGRMTRKMQANSLADLVNMAARLRLGAAPRD